MLYFLLILIVIFLWEISGELRRANSRMFGDSDPGIDFYKPKKELTPVVVTWVSRGTVFAVMIALVWCLFYINR